MLMYCSLYCVLLVKEEVSMHQVEEGPDLCIRTAGMSGCVFLNYFAAERVKPELEADDC